MDSTCVYTPALVKVGKVSFFCFFTNSAGIDDTDDRQGIMLEKPRHRGNKENVQSAPF